MGDNNGLAFFYVLLGVFYGNCWYDQCSLSTDYEVLREVKAARREAGDTNREVSSLESEINAMRRELQYLEEKCNNRP